MAITMKVLNDRDLSKMMLRNMPAFDVVVKVLVRCFLGAHQRLALLLEKLGYTVSSKHESGM